MFHAKLRKINNKISHNLLIFQNYLNVWVMSSEGFFISFYLSQSLSQSPQKGGSLCCMFLNRNGDLIAGLLSTLRLFQPEKLIPARNANTTHTRVLMVSLYMIPSPQIHLTFGFKHRFVKDCSMNCQKTKFLYGRVILKRCMYLWNSFIQSKEKQS